MATAVVLAALASAAAAGPDGGGTPRVEADRGLNFEQVFTDQGEPPTVQFRARFLSHGAQHVLRVWRDGGSRLVRRTDDAIEAHVTHTPGDPAYRMVVLDLHRRIETLIARDDLYRIGNFTDWYDLAHGLRHPQGAYRLTPTRVPAAAPRPLQPCRWYALEQAGRTTQVCWSTRERLPLLIVAGNDQVLWQVTELAHAPVPAAVFEVRDHGFVRNDAHQDISGD